MRSEQATQKPFRPDGLPDITPEQIDYYIQQGKRQQALAIQDAIRRGWAALAALAGRPGAPTVAQGGTQETRHRPGDLAESARNALAAIRSSAELLREDGIAPAERSRFAEIVLVEERRLGALLGQLLDRGRRSTP